MKILAVEASTQACSVSLKTEQGVITEFELAPQKHANLMLSQVDKLLKEAQLEGSELDGLAFGEGPGAFTGVRIAAGVVQGLAYGWQKPVVAISSLEALAWQASKSDPTIRVLACLDARMKEIYTQHCWVEQGLLKSESPELLSAEEVVNKRHQLKVAYGVGDLQTEYPELAQSFEHWQQVLPSAEAVAEIAQQRFDSALSVKQHVPVPVYLRNNVADKKRPV